MTVPHPHVRLPPNDQMSLSRYQHLQRFTVIHGVITFWNAIRSDCLIEDQTRIDPTFHHVGKQLTDVATCRRWSASNDDIRDRTSVERP
jgi:hypothetical protein